MEQEILKVLAVADPAVNGYLDKKLGILDGYKENVEFQIVPWSEYYDKMMESLTGSGDYDIIMVAGHLWLSDFVKKGYLAELELEEEDILPAIVREMSYQDKAYLSPSFCDGHMIVYRKSLINKVLGKELEPVITPQEYLDTAKALAAVYGRKAVAMKADSSEIFTDALPFLRMYGGDAYDSEGNPICGDEKAIRGLQSYCECKSYALAGTEHFANEEIADAIRKKKAVMAVTWSGQLGAVWENGCLEPEDLGFSTFSTAWNVTWSFAICSESRKREAASDFLRYLRSSVIDCKTGRLSGAPVRESSYQKGNAPWFPVQKMMIESAGPLPHINRSGDKNAILYQKIYQAFTGELSAREAMESAEREIADIT
ncbi:extracellular solute-binding protein [Lacrimispora sp.]|uniref:extracellular solute-binding protein n=1 Tax=Lacrimispora sp. TaxID=2719234 RepID=UPI0032E3E176